MTHFAASALSTANLIELLYARLEADNDHQGMILLAELEEHRADVLLQHVSQMVAIREHEATNTMRDSQESLESRFSATVKPTSLKLQMPLYGLSGVLQGRSCLRG
ncbi:MAG: hypothetical protein NXH70_08310 [Hyphomonas sp.]|nr:hypothetical protein [Hyphomonas sp.]